MWQNVNGEWLWMDQEMGFEEVERERFVARNGLESYTYGDVRDAGRRLSKGDIAVGVAGGLIVAKAVPRVGSWLLWMALLVVACLVFA